MYASLHCNDANMEPLVRHWHKDSGPCRTFGPEYITVNIRSGNDDCTLFLTPDQAGALETAIGQCLRDRAAVLSEVPADDETVYIGLDGVEEPQDGCGGGPVG